MGSEKKTERANPDEAVFTSLNRKLIEWSRDQEFQKEFKRWKEGGK